MTSFPFSTNGLIKTGLLVLALLMAACQPNDHDVTVSAATGEFIDYGFIPAGGDGSQDAAEFQSAFYDNNHVYVATTDGNWACDLQTKAWSRVGLAGKEGFRLSLSDQLKFDAAKELIDLKGYRRIAHEGEFVFQGSPNVYPDGSGGFFQEAKYQHTIAYYTDAFGFPATVVALLAN